MIDGDICFGQRTQSHDVAVSLYSNRSAAQGASWRGPSGIAPGWSRASASRRPRYRQACVQAPRRATVETSAVTYGCLRQTAEGSSTWGVWCGASGEGGQPEQSNTLPWSLTAVGGTIELWELAAALWPGGVSVGGADPGRAVYFRRRMTIRSLSHLADPWD